MNGNPWGLNAKQIHVIEALIDMGSYKAVTKAFGLSDKAIEGRLARARQQMGVPYGDRIKYLIQYDRWKQSCNTSGSSNT